MCIYDIKNWVIYTGLPVGLNRDGRGGGGVPEGGPWSARTSMAGEQATCMDLALRGGLPGGVAGGASTRPRALQGTLACGVPVTWRGLSGDSGTCHVQARSVLLRPAARCVWPAVVAPAWRCGPQPRAGPAAISGARAHPVALKEQPKAPGSGSRSPAS